MALKKLFLDKVAALGGSAPYNLVGVEDAHDWSNGSKGSRIGTYYTILRVTDMEKQRVFVPDNAPAISADAVLQGAASLKFYQVDFDGLSAFVSPDKSGNLRIYAEATAIRFIKNDTPLRKDS